MHLFALVGLFVLVSSCSKFEYSNAHQAIKPLPESKVILAALARHSKKTGQEFLQETNKLVDQIDQFLAEPTETAQSHLQIQWQSTHIAYTNAQLGLFSATNAQHYRIDAWPIQPGFIDNLEAYPFSGIVFDETLSIDLETIVNQHGITDRQEVVLGLHSLELLIFTRPTSDFQPNSDKSRDRRRQLLKLVAEKFLEDSVEIIEANSVNEEGDSNLLLRDFLDATLVKIRASFHGSNLVAAEEIGHCLARDRSLEILLTEVSSLEQFFVTKVPLIAALKSREPETHANFLITLEEAKISIQESTDDELALAILPLQLSALIHQIEAFRQSLGTPP